jgi:hypothetical protein
VVWFGVVWVGNEEMQEIHQPSSPESGVMATDGWGQTSTISQIPFSSKFLLNGFSLEISVFVVQPPLNVSIDIVS